MATPRHKGDTKTFDELGFSEQAKSIAAQLVNLGRAIRRHAIHQDAASDTGSKCVEQVRRFHARLATALGAQQERGR
jgi:hypothetical protein